MRVFRYKIIIKIIKHFSSELIIQQRDFDNKLSFFKDWNSYKSWRGLQEIHELTKTDLYSLNISIETKDGKEIYAETSLYKVTVGGFSGTIERNHLYHGCDDGIFVTFDKDKLNSAARRHAGWWYCDHTNLNGIMKERTNSDYDHVHWYDFISGRGYETPYKTRMNLILKTTL